MAKRLQREILVNVDQGETRVAVLEDGVLVELMYERPVHQRAVGNIYKGKVENVLPGMQAAFVNIGLERNAFLYVTDALPQRGADEDDEELDIDPRRLSIKDVLKPNQDVIVQVTKEAIGSKGARITTQLTLPGRFLVLMPTVDYVGVSRRIGDARERDRLRHLAEQVKPDGMGLIVRTVAEGKDAAALEQDVAFLTRLWTKIQNRARSNPAPHLLHKDLGLVYRVVRDSFNDEVTRFVIDSRPEHDRVLELLDDMAPDLKDRVQLYTNRQRPVLEAHGIEGEVEKALKRRVWLKSGGFLVIDQTEALTVIDVNTGKFVGSTNLADTVLRTNLEAAAEIARQLRLRDIGGIIVIDFIDMESERHRRQVVRQLEAHLARDRVRSHVLGITQLGLVEMTRKKARQSLEDVIMKPCPYCDGKGKVQSEETVANRVRREIRAILRDSDAEAMLIEMHPAPAALVIGSGGANLRELERETGKTIYVRGSEACHLAETRVRVLGTREEVERLALPVRQGEVVEVKVEEPHVANTWDGIARIEGYVVDVEGGSRLVGERVKVEITKVHRTYAKARVVGDTVD